MDMTVFPGADSQPCRLFEPEDRIRDGRWDADTRDDGIGPRKSGSTACSGIMRRIQPKKRGVPAVVAIERLAQTPASVPDDVRRSAPTGRTDVTVNDAIAIHHMRLDARARLSRRAGDEEWRS
jgi:hypothetical protein